MDEYYKGVEANMKAILDESLKFDAVHDALFTTLDIKSAMQQGAMGVTKICASLQKIIDDEVTSHENGQQNIDPNNLQKLEQRDSGVVQEYCLRTLITCLADRKNRAQCQFVSNVINQLVNNKAISAKHVCLGLLAHDQMKPENEIFWVYSFKLIKNIISGVDYKGVREIMKNCLERAKQLPVFLTHSMLEPAQRLKELLELILDRNAALLPGYFIVNELLKLHPDCKSWPHWKLSQMLINFVDEFRKSAQMLSIVGRHRLRPVIHHSGHTSPSVYSWKLNHANLKFPVKGVLPYSESMQKPQTELLSYVFSQPSSKEMIMAMLDMQKKRYPILEEQLVELILKSMNECADYDDECIAAQAIPQPTTPTAEGDKAAAPKLPNVPLLPAQCHCAQITSLLIYFVLNQLILFKSLIVMLRQRLARFEGDKPIRGRDHLTWCLLQFLSGTITKNPVSDFQPVVRLIELLYPEKDPLPLPDYYNPRCTLQLAPTSILMHILRKARTDNRKVPQVLPPAFNNHNDFLQSLLHNPQVSLFSSNGFPCGPLDYRIALLLNAFSTNQEVFHRPIWALVETIQGSTKSTVSMPGTNCVALGATVPFSMNFLDSLTIHVKMSILHHISTESEVQSSDSAAWDQLDSCVISRKHINKHSSNKSTYALAPALVESYARLLVYSETETIGIKHFINVLLPNVFKNQTWGIFHALLEMFTYRIHHSPPQYRVHLLSTIHHMSVPLNTMSNLNQLHLCVESCALKLITGLANAEVMPNLTRPCTTDAKPTVISTESEELNRVLVLTLAKAIHVTGCDTSGDSGRWVIEFLKAVQAQTPHSWASHTLKCFPPIIAEFYRQNGEVKETQSLKKAVEEEFLKWKSMSSESDFLAHFPLQQSTSNLFLCLLFKMVFETNRVPAEAYKILERLGPRQLMAHVRTLCDFLVLEFSNSAVGHHLSKCVDTMNSIIWTFNIVPVERLILCLVLRTQEGVSEAQVCLFIIQLLLLRPAEFRNRVNDIVAEQTPEHWKQNNWYERHIAFHRKFPEKYAPATAREGQGGLSSLHQTLPIYFTNVCMRFLPILDIVIHRCLEVQQVHKRLEIVLDNLASLYKFHDRPISFLFTTLHYYEQRLREAPVLKKQLVRALIKSQSFRPDGWALTAQFMQYLNKAKEDIAWAPGPLYYHNTIHRLVQTLQGKKVFPHLEWRFNEFANVGSHALNVTCVEIMTVPDAPDVVANAVIDTVIKGYFRIRKQELLDWVNAIGHVLACLPEAYWLVVHDRIVALLQAVDNVSGELLLPRLMIVIDKIGDLASPGPRSMDPFLMMDVDKLLPLQYNMMPALTVALVHSFWHHSPAGQVGKVLQLIRETICPILKTEEQLIVLYHIVSAFLQRLSSEDPRKIFDIPVELYQALANVDKYVVEMKYEDAICDLLYHIKYMFTGDTIKSHVEGIVRGLRPSLQLRLRFITHLNLDEIENVSVGNNVNTPQQPNASHISLPLSTPTPNQ